MRLTLTACALALCTLIACFAVASFQLPAQADESPKTPGSQADPKPQDPKPADPQPEPPKLADIPKGEKMADGVQFKVPYKRGAGTLTFSRQNGYLRVDADVRLLYNAGDGIRMAGSAVALVLSVDGYSGRIFIHYPSPVWIPSRPDVFPPFRSEKTYNKDKPTPLAGESSFAASSNVKFSDRWTTTLWINLRRVITAGNTPDSPADTWRAAFMAGDMNMQEVLPDGVNPTNPAITPARMFTFTVSELPEREAAKSDPFEAANKYHEDIYRDLRSLLATFSLPRGATPDDVNAAILKGFNSMEVICKAYPDLLLARYLRWQLAIRLGKKVEADPLALLKDYVDACPSQLQAQITYIDALIRAKRRDDALKRIDELLTGDATSTYPPAQAKLKLDLGPLLIDAGEAAAALKIYESLMGSEVLKTDMLMSLRCAVGGSRAAFMVGDKEKEAKFLDISKREPAPTQEDLRPLIDYVRSLFSLGYEDEGIRAARALCDTPLLTGNPQVLAEARMTCAESLLRTNYAADQAYKLYEAVFKSDVYKDNDMSRFGAQVGMARALEVQGDFKGAIQAYGDVLEREKLKLTQEQANGLKQLQDFQKTALKQWEEEEKFIAEDAKKTNPRLTIETAKGKIVVELFEDDAPNTVASLVSLTQKKFYDGLTFHRFEPNFVIQGGDPNGDGSGGPDYRLPSEVSKRNHFRGTFAMACTRPKENTEGSQFYICTSNGPSVLNLSGKYVVAGRVIEGMDVAMRLRPGDVMTKVTASNLRNHEYVPKPAAKR